MYTIIRYPETCNKLNVYYNKVPQHPILRMDITEESRSQPKSDAAAKREARNMSLQNTQCNLRK